MGRRIKDEYVKEVIEKINNRSISSSNDLIEFIEERVTLLIMVLYETEEQISMIIGIQLLRFQSIKLPFMEMVNKNFNRIYLHIKYSVYLYIIIN
jgi:hypothetical protein